MVIEKEVPPFLEWFPEAFAYWIIVVAALSVVGLVLSYLFFSARKGPAAGTREVLRMISDGVSDLLWISPRRVFALARLAVQESWRRRVWVAVVFFWAILAFSAWFLKGATTEAAKLHLGFVLGWSTFLSLMVALFLSVFSLPNDMAKKTIYTIVTKPVRSSEIVLGRIAGFTAVGTGLLLVMAATSYAFVTLQLRHTHAILAEDLSPLPSSANGGAVLVGRTSRDMEHRHAGVRIFPDRRGVTDVVNGHSHDITVEKGPDGNDRYVVHPPHDMLVARVPIYGKLKFRDEAGNETLRAGSVGDEWNYRQYIEGGTATAAIWRFAGVRPDDFPDGLPLQMSFGVFRTYKGNVEEGIPAEITLRNPRTRFSVVADIIRPREFVLNTVRIPRELVGPNGASVDLYRDLVSAGEVEIQVRCVPPAQYLGMAQADLYIAAPEASFRLNLAKGYLGIWLQMLLITAFGVTFSTFLNGPVSLIATLSTLVFGYFSMNFMQEMLRGNVPGGGPFESLIRMVNQSNVMSELEPGLYRTLAETGDKLFQGVLFVTVSLLPDIKAFSDVNFVTDGFNIPVNNLLVHGTMALGYLTPLVGIGYFILRRREVAK